MLKPSLLIGVVFLGSLDASAASAAPTFYTSKASFLSALQSSSTQTFNTLSSAAYGSPGTLSIGGLTIQTTGPLFTQAANYYNTGTFVSAQQTTPTNVKFTFPSVSAFGFDYSTGISGTLTANGSNFTFAATGFPNLGFVGVIDFNALSTASINLQGNGIDLDNVITGTAAATAVPEPSAWVMMVLGMGAVGYATRRRRGAPQRSYAV